jgi:hypothetical protein
VFRGHPEGCETLERCAYTSDQGNKNLMPNFNGVAEIICEFFEDGGRDGKTLLGCALGK